MEEGIKTTKERFESLLREAREEVRVLVGDTLRLEQDQIHKKQATGIAADIVDITKKLVK